MKSLSLKHDKRKRPTFVHSFKRAFPLASFKTPLATLKDVKHYHKHFRRRHSVAPTIHSCPRQPQRPTRCTASKGIFPHSRAANLRPNNRRPRQAWKRKGRLWICLVTTILLSCSPNNNLHLPTLANSKCKRCNRKTSIRRLKFNNNRFLHLFVIQIQIHQNVIAHLTTYHLILI